MIGVLDSNFQWKLVPIMMRFGFELVFCIFFGSVFNEHVLC